MEPDFPSQTLDDARLRGDSHPDQTTRELVRSRAGLALRRRGRSSSRYFSWRATLTSPDPVTRAIAGMALGLFLFWIVLGGALSLLLRKRVRSVLRRFDAHWRIAFVLFATVLALLEEAVTTTMTNAAPLWGVPVGKAYITASANYLEVVLYHSVIVFVPMFIAWAWLLRRYAFSPAAVFVLYGCSGALAETRILRRAEPGGAGLLGLRLRPDDLPARLRHSAGARRAQARRLGLSARADLADPRRDSSGAHHPRAQSAAARLRADPLARDTAFHLQLL